MLIDTTVMRMEKLASFKLPKDPTKWNQEILRHLFESNEWINADNYHIRWSSQFDGEKGYGTGVIVLDKEKRTVSIPVIVKNFKLEPLDVFYFEKDLFPLTPKTLSDALHHTEIAEKAVDQGKSNTAMFDHIFPPNWGRYIHASVDPKRLCEAIEIREDDLVKASERVEKYAAAFFGRDQHLEYFNRVIHREPIKDDEIEKLASYESVVVSKDDDLGYKVSHILGGEYNEFTTGYGGLLKFASDNLGLTKEAVDSCAALVDAGHDAPLLSRQKVAAITSAQAQSAPITSINDDSFVLTQTKSGEQIEGMVVASTYSFETKRMTKTKLLIDKNRNILAVGDAVIGIRQGKAPLHQVFHSTRMTPARPGMVVSFLWRNEGSTPSGGSSMALATQPAKIISVDTHPEGVLYTVMSDFGGRHRVMILKNNRRPVFNVDNDRGAIYLPENTVILFAAHDNLPNLVGSVDEFKKTMVKESSAYEIQRLKTTGEILVKTASESFSGKPLEIKTRLVGKGIDIDTVDEALVYATKLGSATIFAEAVEPEPGMEKQADGLEKMVEELRDFVASKDLVKVAVDMNDIDTADKVLALNFINRRNLMTLYKMLPKFKESVSALAKLLLSSRVGKVGVNQTSVAEAMHALQSLVEKMEGLQIDENRN